MVKFRISQALFKQFPQLQVGIILLPQFDNAKPNPKIQSFLANIQAELKTKYTVKDLETLPNITLWREAYAFFGAKPKKYKSSVEALLTRVLENNTISSINNLVDAYNYISLKYLLPFGADDLSNVSSDIKLTFAEGTEQFQALGTTEIRNPERGEVVYKHNNDILCRRWNWRESDLTKITKDTTSAILYAETLTGDQNKLKEALHELQQLIGGEVFILTADTNCFDLKNKKIAKDSYNEFHAKSMQNQPPKPTEKSTQSEASTHFEASKQKPQDKDSEELYHWTDVAADRVIKEKGDKLHYTLAAGITPSGTVHIGNFREIITVDLVKRALEKRGKKVRFIYSWDDYDVFRKVPKNMPKQDVLVKFLRFPIVDTPDTFGCHESYARHHEAEVEESISAVGIAPEFLYQAKKYRSGVYNEQIKVALEHTEQIKSCLNEYREEEVDNNWLPISLFCEKCKKDTISELKWLGGYMISYSCECGQRDQFDFRKKTGVKLKWRIDWPMRWKFESVDFEPGGKDHSTVGGSFDTGKKIVKAVWNFEAPTYVMYDFISTKGGAGKMSSSSGEVITLKDVLEIYEPEIARYLFAGTRPNKEFAISFDADVIKIYEDFDKCERIYYGLEKVNEKEAIKQKVAYELSYIGKIPKTISYQPGFRHLTTLLQIHNLEVDKAVCYFESELKNEHDRKRLHTRALCAKTWLQKYAPEEFKFSVQEKVQVAVTLEQKAILHTLAKKLRERNWTDVELHEEMYILCTNAKFQVKDFFTLAYTVLIHKEKGPRLASFILAIGKEKVAKLFEGV